jgi:hypothetical protein
LHIVDNGVLGPEAVVRARPLRDGVNVAAAKRESVPTASGFERAGAVRVYADPADLCSITLTRSAGGLLRA